MTIGTSNSTTLSFIAESTPGQTPNNPAMQLLRFTGESLEASNTTTVSEEIRDDRATSDIILTDQSNKGDIMCEVSGATYDELMEAALYADSTWSTDLVSGSTLASVTGGSAGFTDSADGFITAGFQVGQYVKVTGFAAATNALRYRILTVAAGAITTYPAPPTAQVSGVARTVVGSTIKSGKTDHAFTIQKAHKGIATPAYQNFRGCRVATMSQQLAVGAIAKMTFGITALNSEITTTQIAGLTEDARTTTKVMNCVGDVTQIIAQSAGLTTEVKFTELSFTYDNKLRELKAIGQLGSVDVRPGTIDAKATINPYFENIEMLQAFLANASFHLAWHITGSDGYGYVFSFPNVKFSTQSLAAGAKDTDMIIKAEVMAILDPASLTTMRIDRFVP